MMIWFCDCMLPAIAPAGCWHRFANCDPTTAAIRQPPSIGTVSRSRVSCTKCRMQALAEWGRYSSTGYAILLHLARVRLPVSFGFSACIVAQGNLANEPT